ncbi:MAG TPA: type II toxin-antitoxin system Phd/YefM family antitoxin [Burkholderiales bacterium]|nr:type II toxin-antitoxin system Phd/YefM family antitoxin [Burkholderiales bacterium]
MQKFDATTAKNQFGRLLEAAAQGPVAVTRHGRVVAYVAAPKDFAAPPQSLEERLAERLRAAGVRYAALFGSLARGAARRGATAISTLRSASASRSRAICARR